jgi:hypothetical protein
MVKENDQMIKTDFSVNNHGTIWTFEPLTEGARDHAVEHFPEETPTLGLAYAVEHRFAPDIVTALLSEGFAVELDGYEVELPTRH